MQLRLPAQLISALLALTLLPACSVNLVQVNQKSNISAPIAAKYHKLPKTGDKFAWLRNTASSDTQKYMAAESAYADVVLKPLQSFQSRIYQELLDTVPNEEASVPIQIDDYLYYSREQKGLELPLFFRKKVGLSLGEELVLDPNTVLKTYNIKNPDLGIFKISPDHKKIAFTVDSGGKGLFRICIWDLANNQSSMLKATRVHGLEWANDSATIFYTVTQNGVSHTLFRHVSNTASSADSNVDNNAVEGEKSEQDALILEAQEANVHIGLSKSKTKQYIFVHADTLNTSDVYYLDADHPSKEPKQVQPKVNGIRYSVEHRIEAQSSEFIMRTYGGTSQARIISKPVKDFQGHKAKRLVETTPGFTISNMDVFEKFLVVYELGKQNTQLRVFDFASQRSTLLAFPEDTYQITKALHPNYSSSAFRYAYNSPTTVRSVFQYDTLTKRTTSVSPGIINRYDPARYTSKLIFAKSPDGARIPMTVIMRQGLQLDGANPTLLYGYGAYGVRANTDFSAERLSLLSRGVIYVICHVRGGSYSDPAWHDQGRLLKKKNSMLDFIACAEQLGREKYTNPEKLAALGRSAGGTLVAGAVNMRPDLFKVVALEAPFLDVVAGMSDPKAPLTEREYEEWGDPSKAKERTYMASYSPYANIKKQSYPHILITSALRDKIVPVWQSVSYVAKLRSIKADQNILALHISASASHSGENEQYRVFQEEAWKYAFIMNILGISR